jgi:hypothetical protein
MVPGDLITVWSTEVRILAFCIHGPTAEVTLPVVQNLRNLLFCGIDRTIMAPSVTTTRTMCDREGDVSLR